MRLGGGAKGWTNKLSISVCVCGEFLSLSYLVYVKRKLGEISRLMLATLLKVKNGPIFQFLYLKDVIS